MDKFESYLVPFYLFVKQGKHHAQIIKVEKHCDCIDDNDEEDDDDDTKSTEKP